MSAALYDCFKGKSKYITKHLMYGPEGNSWFCFPESPDVSRDEVEGNIRTRGTKH